MAKNDETKGKAESGAEQQNGGSAAQNTAPANGVKAQAEEQSQQQQSKPSQQQAGAGTPCADMIKADHRRVDQLFKQYESAEDGQKDQLIRQICQELTIHTMLEEELFYPACRKAAEDEADTLDEAQVEHDAAKMLIEDLRRGRSGDQYRDAKVKVLAEEIRHHVQEEEKPRDGILAQAKARGVDTPELAQRLEQRKQELMQRGDRLPPARPVSIGGYNASNQEQERNMARQGPDRDERGRFASDDDDRGGRSMRGGGGRDRDYDDDRRGGRGGGRGEGGWFGDSQGHSEAARRGWEERSYASRGRDDDDDRRGGRGGGGGRGEGGWFGDPEGHSEASRRGWESRDDYRSRGRDDDDDRRGGRGGGGGGRGEGGWFGDSQGHSEAARRGWENRDDYRGRGGRDDDDRRGGGGRDGDRSQGGWFGDSRGHAEAARRGWESRDDDRGRGRDDDDRGYRSRSRDDDDDDRRGGRGGRGGGRGEGGWFGDSQGHAEAARRGWQDRR